MLTRPKDGASAPLHDRETRPAQARREAGDASPAPAAHADTGSNAALHGLRSDVATGDGVSALADRSARRAMSSGVLAGRLVALTWRTK